MVKHIVNMSLQYPRVMLPVFRIKLFRTGIKIKFIQPLETANFASNLLSVKCEQENILE
jgi:hypothetical protein